MLKCPSCTRVDADMGTCGSALSCPMRHDAAPVTVEPGLHVVLHCDICDVTRAVSSKAIGRRQQPMDHTCPRDESTCGLRSMDLLADPLVLNEEPHGTVHKRGPRRQHAGPKGTPV